MPARNFIREHLEEGDPDGYPLHVAVAKLRDEVTAYQMLRYRGHNRELSMLIARLDEAKHWATEHKLKTGELALVDRANLLRIATDTTETTETGIGNV